MDGAIAEMVGASAGCDEVIMNGIYMNVATIQICEVLDESKLSIKKMSPN